MINKELTTIHPTVKQLNATQLREVLNSHNLYPVVTILISEQRLSACDIGILISQEEYPVSLAMIMTRSIQYSAEPEIAVLYTIPSFRGKGFGKLLLIHALDICQQIGYPTIHINASSRGTAIICNNLSPDLKKMLHIHDSGLYLDDLISSEEHMSGYY